jgi:hypothetical protein
LEQTPRKCRRVDGHRGEGYNENNHEDNRGHDEGGGSSNNGDPEEEDGHDEGSSSGDDNDAEREDSHDDNYEESSTGSIESTDSTNVAGEDDNDCEQGTIDLRNDLPALQHYNDLATKCARSLGANWQTTVAV